MSGTEGSHQGGSGRGFRELSGEPWPRAAIPSAGRRPSGINVKAAGVEPLDGAAPVASPRPERDLAEQRVLLERLQQAQRVARVGTFEWNLVEQSHYWSPELFALLGLADGACVPSMERWYSHVEESERSAATWRFLEACLSQQPEYHAELCLRRADGAEQWVSVSKALQFDPRGKLVRVVGAAVALRGSLERERRAREAALEGIAILTHDFGNPLSAISASSLQLARTEGLDPTLLRLANRIQLSAGRMRRMLEQLLDLTRARVNGRLALDCTRVDLGVLAAELCDELATAYPGRAPRLSSAGDASGWWDRGRLAQLVSNLLVNAVQHGTGAASAQLDGTAPDQVTLSVHNDEAIAAELLPRIFEPFVRGGSERHGLGLGLYIAREVARSHGGEIQVDSSAQRGTTFRVTLPRRASAQ